jgi:hypothetical protein
MSTRKPGTGAVVRSVADPGDSCTHSPATPRSKTDERMDASTSGWLPSTSTAASSTVTVWPGKSWSTSRRISNAGVQPSAMPSQKSSSQSAPVPKALDTTRTTQVPPAFASTRNSVAIGVTSAPGCPPRAAQSGST